MASSSGPIIRCAHNESLLALFQSSRFQVRYLRGYDGQFLQRIRDHSRLQSHSGAPGASGRLSREILREDGSLLGLEIDLFAGVGQ